MTSRSYPSPSNILYLCCMLPLKEVNVVLRLKALVALKIAREMARQRYVVVITSFLSYDSDSRTCGSYYS